MMSVQVVSAIDPAYRQTSSKPQYSRAMSIILVNPRRLMVVPQVLRMTKWGATKSEDSLGKESA